MPSDDQPKTTYRFYSTVRRGYRPSRPFDINSEIGSLADAGKLSVDFKVEADDGAAEGSDTVDLRMYGPGDVVGIDPRQIVRMDPEPGTTDLPPNHFAVVEFDAPDLPWLFSPVREDSKGRTLPWCGLVVLERTDEVRVRPAGTGPLPTIEAPVGKLPPVREMWAWAHAQMVGGPTDATDVREGFRGRSNFTRSRLISPRNLQPNQSYVAVVVPVFEAGRLAGLGRDPQFDGDEAVYAWPAVQDGGGATVELPVYHSWEFSTGQQGDFEFLVRKLEPTNLSDPDYDIGRRDIDVSDPGPELLEIHESTDGEEAARGSVEGAFRKKGAPSLAPYTRSEELRALLNAVDPVIIDGKSFDVVGPPVYGEWHAQEFTLEEPRESEGENPHGPDQWVYDLNLQPGYRVGAAIGGEIVRDQQEKLMASAWEQVGQIRDSNRLLARAQLSEYAMRRQMGSFGAYPAGWLLQFTGPAHDRLLTDDQGPVGEHLRTSRLPTAVLSAAFRRLTRPSGRLANRLEAAPEMDELVEDLANGVLEIAPSPDTPEGMATVEGAESPEGLCRRARRESPPEEERIPASVQAVLDALRQMRDLTTEMLHLLLELVPGLDGNGDGGDGEERRRSEYDSRHDALMSAIDAFEPLLQVLVDENPRLERVSDELNQARKDEILEKLLEAGSSAELPAVDVGREGTDLEAALGALQRLLGVLDEVDRLIGPAEGDALRYLADLLCSAVPERDDFTPPDIAAVLSAFDPVAALVARLDARLGGIDLASRPVPLDRVMAYPRFPQPMYRDLKELSEAYLLPGVSQIPDDSVGALETNPQFIEAFMVGLNHEMASELLWRRYPTDRRGSYFRQFWDPAARIPRPDDEDLLKDVTELHTWDDKAGPGGLLDSPLGSNVMTGAGGADEADEGATSQPTSNVVVVVRGKLLRRYPTTTIYAVKARGIPNEDGDLDHRVPEWPAQTEDGIDTEFARFPIFRGELEPDITFLGFDLTSEEAVGTESTPSLGDAGDEWVQPDGTDGLGWYIVFEEPPGEPRFGIDVDPDAEGVPVGVTVPSRSPEIETYENPRAVELGWKGLKWGHIPDQGDPSEVTNLSIKDSQPGEDDWSVAAGTVWGQDSDGDDLVIEPERAAIWGENSAHMAFILWQTPVRIAIHADDLLPIDDSS